MPGPEAASADAPDSARDASPDVFVSYAREDRKHAQWVVRVLTGRGWSVWSDQRMRGGDVWPKEIERALDRAKCVVVLWSAASVNSNWVMDEAGEGMARGILVPALLDDVEIPLGFRQAHAIDVSEQRVPRERAEAALVAGVAGVLGRPPVVPKRPALRRWAWKYGLPMFAFGPLAIALPLLLRPVASTVIDLDVNVSEVGFVAAGEQDIIDMAVVSAVDAWGLVAIYLPRTRGDDEERVVSSSDGRGTALGLAGSGDAGREGSITLSGLRVSAGSHVRVAAPDTQRLRIGLTGSSVPVDLNVEGILRMGLPEIDAEHLDFGRPKRLTLDPDPRGADLEIRRMDGKRTVVSGPVDIAELSLLRVDETLETQRAELTEVSTILAGRVRLDAPDGRERMIGVGERLQFAGPAGEIRALEVANGGLRLRFYGAVRGLESCAAGGCGSWMPSTFESLVARKLFWVSAAGLLWLVGLLSLTRWRYGWFRRS